MSKKIFIFSLVLVFSISSYASTNKIALEIARAKEIDKVVKRINNIYDFINIFVMQTASTPTNFSQLNAEFDGLVNNGFRQSDLIDFSINNNIVTFTNFIPSNITPLSEGVLRNNLYLNENALVNRNNAQAGSTNELFEIIITLKAKSIQVLNASQLIRDNHDNSIVQSDAPSCASNVDLGNAWYRPDGLGEYYVSFCVEIVIPNEWQYFTNKIDTAIISDDINKLTIIKPRTGTIGYLLEGAVYQQYIYTGDDSDALTVDWIKVINN